MAAFIDHVSVPVADFPAAARFYDAVLGTLGLVRRKERPGESLGFEFRPDPFGRRPAPPA